MSGIKGLVIIIVGIAIILAMALPVTVMAEPPYPVDVTDGVFTGWPSVNEWQQAGVESNQTPQGTYIYFLQHGDYIYQMHDVVIDEHDSVWDTNYFPLWYRDGTTYEVWIHAVAIGSFNLSHVQLSPIDHNELTGVEVGWGGIPDLYDFEASAGFGTSPNSATPHRMYEFRFKTKWFVKISICDIVVTSDLDQIDRFGGIDPQNLLGLARYASGTNLIDWQTFGEFASETSSACFIATAAYGTPMAEQVDVLRDFRDQYLITNPVGKAFVELYYKISPPMAEFITEHPAFKPVVRVGLLPAVALSRVAVNTTLPQKVAIISSVALVSALLVVWAFKRAGKFKGKAD